MRKEFSKFEALECAIVDLGPDDAHKFKAYWAEHGLPFPGLADPDHRVGDLYGQQVRLLKLGRLPLQLVVDREGIVRYRHESNSMADIPHTDEVLAELRKLL